MIEGISTGGGWSATGGASGASGSNDGQSSANLSKTFGNTGGINLSINWLIVAAIVALFVLVLWWKK